MTLARRGLMSLLLLAILIVGCGQSKSNVTDAEVEAVKKAISAGGKPEDFSFGSFEGKELEVEGKKAKFVLVSYSVSSGDSYQQLCYLVDGKVVANKLNRDESQWKEKAKDLIKQHEQHQREKNR